MFGFDIDEYYSEDELHEDIPQEYQRVDTLEMACLEDGLVIKNGTGDFCW